jgi:hypothetical protein
MEFSIGKYTLESLTTGMYLGPRVMYREYIQNAIDSIDEAVERGVLADKEKGRINISLDNISRSITIEDNGLGLKVDDAAKALLDIGNSQKSYAIRRGFRGIGRLVGLSYSTRLTFQTSYLGETVATMVSFNSEQLRKMLIPGEFEEFDLKEVLKHVTNIERLPEHSNAHYFRVVLEGIDNRENVLEKDDVLDYIAQTAPVPYNYNIFPCGVKIKEFFIRNGLSLEEYNIFIKTVGEEEQQIFKPYRERFLADRQKKIWDTVVDIEVESICNSEGKIVGIVWFSQSNYLGTILNDGIKGLRFRKGNILVGDKVTFNAFFKEERFNGWFQGEIFVLDERTIPNSRRDDFEKNNSYLELEAELKLIGVKLHKIIRGASNERSKLKSVAPNKGVKEITSAIKLDYCEDEIFERSEENVVSGMKSLQTIRELQMLGKEQVETKYEILNISSRLTVSEKKKLEKVFDTILEECGQAAGEKVILAILEKLNVA